MSQSVPRRGFWRETRQNMNVIGLLGSPIPNTSSPSPCVFKQK